MWAADEYEKLPPFDRPMPYQPAGLFLCHQQNGRVCAGWVGCHGGDNLLGVRLAAINGAMTGEDVAATLDYVSPVALFTSGAEAAEHGRAEIDTPGPGADRVRAKLLGRRRTHPAPPWRPR